MICSIIQVCAFLGMQALKNWFDPGIERYCVPLYLVSFSLKSTLIWLSYRQRENAQFSKAKNTPLILKYSEKCNSAVTRSRDQNY